MPKAPFQQSKVQNTLYHYTIKENADKIRKEGFKTAVELGGTFSGLLIDGIYFTPSTVNYWGGDAIEMEQIAVKVYLKNPLNLSFYSPEKEDYTQQQQVLLKRAQEIYNRGEENYYKINGDNKYNKLLLASETRKAFKEAGYDGIIGFGKDGQEYVVFDKSNIQIIDSDKSKFREAKKKITDKIAIQIYLKNEGQIY